MITNITEYLEYNAKMHAEKTAISQGGGCSLLSFKTLRQKARAIATYIIRLGISGEAIPVLTKEIPDTLALFFGIAYSGNFYVPLDEATPKDRLDIILTNCHAKIVVGTNSNISFDNITYININDMLGSVDDDLVEKVASGITSSDPLYMVYTSGSTGTPKGVIKSHGSIINFIENFVETFSLSDEVIGCQTPFYFDASAKDIYLMLKLACPLYIIPKEMFMFPINLIKFLNDNKITYICWVPSALSIVSTLGAFKMIIPKYLRNVFFVGEVMPIKHLKVWQQYVPTARFCNLYGQSEIAGICLYYEVPPDFDGEKLPIGKPLKNSKIYLLGENGEKISNGVGEIVISSPSLALGYFGDKEKTDKVFVANPLIKDYEDRVFVSGDMAEYDSEGNLVYVTRKDFQIKHMGHRIELMEIEVYANAIDIVDSVCCHYDTKRNKIVLFYTLSKDCENADGYIVNKLKEKLPAYMIPNRLIRLDEMPKNKNGKIDRTLLKERI